MSDLPDVTILLGPQTRAAFALNACLRDNGRYLAENGVTFLPSRLASPVIRRALDGRSEKERLAEFDASTRPRPAFLAAVNAFGPPQAGLEAGELFPGAEVTLAGLSVVAKRARLVVAIDPLPAFFLASGSEKLEERVRKTPWEVLYELSWFELLKEIVHLLPEAEVIVATSAAVGRAPRAALRRLLGEVADGLPMPHLLLRHLISETGHAVLERVLARGAPDEETLADLYKSFAVQPDQDEVKERLGIDKVTNALLQNRFAEDLVQIATLDRVEIL